MNMHLHHAIGAATAAIADLSGISFYDKECNSRELTNRAIADARDKLARAAAQLNAYDAKREAVVSP